MPTDSERKCKMNAENFWLLLQIPQAYSQAWGESLSKFQLDTSYRVMKPNVIFDFLALSDPKIQDGYPKSMCIVPDPRQVCVPSVKFIAPKLFKLSSRNQILPLWLCDLENHGHDTKTNRLPQRPMGEATKCQYDSRKNFWVITRKWVSSDRQTDSTKT